jgi:capsular exopolysaccharide synthesis family protein
MHEFPGTTRPAALPGGVMQQGNEENAFAVFLEMLARRRRLSVGLFVFTLALVIVLTAILPKQYTTHVKFIAGAGPGNAQADTQQQTPQTGLPILNALLAASALQSSETYAVMLRETPTVGRVVSELKLNISPTELLRHVVVKPITNTSILDVAVTWGDRKTSAAIANAVASSFVDMRRDLIANQADAATGELSRQLPDAERKMRDAATALTSFETRTGIADVQTQTQSTIAMANQLDQKLAQVQVDQQQAAASLRVVQAQLARTSATSSGGGSVQPNPVAAQLKNQLAQVQVQLQTALQQYTEEHPTVKALRSQEQEIKKELAGQPATIVAATQTVANPLYQQLNQQAATLRAQVAADGAQIEVLRRQRAAADPAIRALPAATQRLTDLKRQAKLTEDVYNALRQKLNDAAIAKTTALSDVTVLAPATPESASVSPNFLMNLVLGLVLAAIVAIAGALIVDHLDGSVKKEEDVEERLALPLLGSVPSLGTSTRPPAPWVQTVMVESIFHLVTSLRYASSGELRTVAFTSAVQGEGKSTIALNTAIAYAELRPRVLLVDADLRIPSLHRKLGIENGAGLSDLLVGTAELEDVVRPTKHAGLDIVTSGTPTPNPLRLLQSESFDRFLEAAKERYEVIVIDASASAAVADSAVVCTKTDGTVFVIACGETDVRVAQRAIAKLQTSGVRNLLGAVLNKIMPRKSEIGAYGQLSGTGSRAFPLPPASRA